MTDELFSQQDAREQADLEELLAPLSAEEQKLFRQYYANGQSSKEIAAEWNVRESWIHNKLSRGRKKIRHMLISRSEV
ncbi:RNA polymerase sigma factor [Jeotgalibacillus aurantiacus]|uniref:RNA polymerase sigma factor n=1 Tax=Jeotgalibacillus aurantiacus TaxID=2763266 RepID=UPI00387376B1